MISETIITYALYSSALVLHIVYDSWCDITAFLWGFLIALRNVIYSFWVLVKCNDILCNLAEEAVDVSSKMQPIGIPKCSWYSMRVVTSKDGLCTSKYLAVSPAVQAQNQWLSYSSCRSLFSQYSDCSILILILLLLRM